MTALLLDGADRDLEEAFDYYERQRTGLGQEMLEEFRRGVDRILEFPKAWQPLDEVYRRYRLRIVYRIDEAAHQALIVCFMHLSRKPDWWRDRVR